MIRVKSFLLAFAAAAFCAGVAANDKSISKLDAECQAGDGFSCVMAGSYYHSGYGVKQDYFKAIEYYQKSCNLQNGDGCNNLGYCYYSGIGVKQDYFKANEYYQKACALQDGGGCYNLGVIGPKNWKCWAKLRPPALF